MPGTLFISDLHLDPERPAVTRVFLEFLETRAREADAVYILGDLFEAWIGDDDASALNLEVIEGMRACVAAGTPIFVMKLDLSPAKKLARENVLTVIDNLNDQGFHLQMPPEIKPDIYHGNLD